MRAVTDSRTGRSPRPGGDEVIADAGHRAGEATAITLAERPQRGTHQPPGKPGSDIGDSLDPRLSITRATGKILIDPLLVTKDPAAHRNKTCGGAAACDACRFYAVAYEAQRQAARAANVIQRQLWRMDGDALDVARAADPAGRALPKPWPSQAVNTYALARAAAPALSGGVASAVAKAVSDAWRTWRFDALVKMTRSPPHYLDTYPLPVRAQEIGAVAKLGPDRYEVSFSVSPGSGSRRGKEFRIPIEARDGYQRRTLEALSTPGTVKIGRALIERHRQKRGKWFLTLTYTRKVERATGAIEAAINRGMVCFLAAVTTTGQQWLYDGNDIEAHLRHIQGRRREYQRDVIASGRTGHGRARTLRPIENLQAAGERWRKSKCQAIARRFSEWLVARGVSRLYVEDFEGIRDGDPDNLAGGKEVWERIQEWPYYQLGTRITSCCEENGIDVVTVPAHWISRRCPACGHIDRERARDVARLLSCSQCGMRKHIDVVAAMNVLGRGRKEWDPKEALASGSPNGQNGEGKRPRRGNGKKG